jgi:hypothetical protein
MKSSGDFSNVQKQRSLNDGNLFEGNKLNPDKKGRKKKQSENFEKIQKESKYSFVVDWQIPEPF